MTRSDHRRQNFWVFFERTWNLIEDTFTSPRSILLVVAIMVAWVVLARWVLPRFVSQKWVVNGVLGIALLALLWFVLDVPSFCRDEDVDDPPGDELAAQLGDGEEERSSSTTTQDAAPSSTASGTTTTTQPPPVRLGGNALQSLDYTVDSGAGVLVQLPDGERVLLLEDLNADPGPDYFVYLVPGADQRSPEGGLELGPLPGNTGNPTFDIPADFELSGTQTVLIWCRSFASPVANT